MSEDARRTAERVARESYGRLIALIAARTRDIAGSEDALADAFQSALRVWPERGVPDNPEAWLLTTARRSLGHQYRHAQVQKSAAATIEAILDEQADQPATILPDHRLKLMFVCAHPSIDETIRTPLMLQTVLGLDAAQIGAAFLLSPAAMGQRLARAKAKIREAGLRFEEPDPETLTDRLEAVLRAIYVAFGTAWDIHGGTEKRHGLTDEAIYLARLIVDLCPQEPEPKGLLALMLYCEARSAARRMDGAFVPLAEQDTHLWSRSHITAAEELLTAAAAAGRFGRFQAEAAIQSVHVMGSLTGTVQSEALIVLYDLLASKAPTIGILVARAAAYGDVCDAAAGLDLLDQIDPDRIQSYQPYWACRAHLVQQTGDTHAAALAFDRAIGLSSDPALREYLIGKKQGLAAAGG